VPFQFIVWIHGLVRGFLDCPSDNLKSANDFERTARPKT
jgi:hypothetical protein